MLLSALHKIPIWKVDSSGIFERWFLQKQPKIDNKILKFCDENQNKNLDKVCP